MKCRRCGGLMVTDHFLDMAGGYGEMWAQSLRCVNCGTFCDAVLEQNRLVRREAVSASTPSNCASNARGEEEIYLGGEALIRPAA